ncbi:hypothetical protein HPT25_16340 [Bacillus sp. BRMEA1]|uniref:hypothetical protein n=1 Tax=Neobacillus endophyticus TaxID=2738405 RepID=UPI0015653366|nr:hypothetical protein [Neobacillus endophyticus]NRD78934.1 hypothetical protein [Neobacillus endophyticus]
MKLIVSKKDMEYFLNHFYEIAEYDSQGNKYYFVFEDTIRQGKWTLMNYEAESKWTLHGKGLNYCDDGEKELVLEELKKFLYKNRKFINNELRKNSKLLVSS